MKIGEIWTVDSSEVHFSVNCDELIKDEEEYMNIFKTDLVSFEIYVYHVYV